MLWPFDSAYHPLRKPVSVFVSALGANSIRRLGGKQLSRSPTMSTIADRIKKIIVDQLGTDPAAVVDDANFVDDLGADSLEVVQVVMEIEEEFGVEIPDSAANTILTVGDAIRFIEKNKA
jgi:acyl carrier protein